MRNAGPTRPTRCSRRRMRRFTASQRYSYACGPCEARGARTREGAARPARAVLATRLAARRAAVDRALALPTAVVPPLRRLLGVVDDPAPLARAARRRRARRARALPRLADAAPAGAHADVVPSPRVRRQSVRGGGTTVRGELLKAFIRVARLPSLPAAAERPGFADAADALLRGDDVPVPEPRLDFLRWLGEHRDVVFHGSPRNDLTELSTERRSSDATEWGNQAAVYASNDPVWALYFAVLRRDAGWTGTRNGTLGFDGERRYFFVHNRGSRSPDLFGPGSLYVLPPSTFEPQPLLGGAIDTAHLV